MKAILGFLIGLMFCLLSATIEVAARSPQEASLPQNPPAAQNATPAQTPGRGGDRRPGLFGKLTADEAVMVDAQGPATKTQVLQNVGEFRLTDYSIEDLKFVQVSATTGLISYKITEKGASHGHEFMAKAYVSSLWTKRAQGWVCLFSQETGTK